MSFVTVELAAMVKASLFAVGAGEHGTIVNVAVLDISPVVVESVNLTTSEAIGVGMVYTMNNLLFCAFDVILGDKEVPCIVKLLSFKLYPLDSVTQSVISISND